MLIILINWQMRNLSHKDMYRKKKITRDFITIYIATEIELIEHNPRYAEVYLLFNLSISGRPFFGLHKNKDNR